MKLSPKYAVSSNKNPESLVTAYLKMWNYVTSNPALSALELCLQSNT